MSLTFKIDNAGLVMKRLQRRNSRFRRLVVRNYTLAADRYIDDIRSKYYSGQKGDVGVNKISHDLHNRWLPVVIDHGDDVSAVISNEMDYAVIHEFGSSMHQKRTDVTGEMEAGTGHDLFVKAGKDALKEAF